MDNGSKQPTDKKLSEQFVDFIDLTDSDLEEVEVMTFTGISGAEGPHHHGCGGGFCGGCGGCGCGGGGCIGHGCIGCEGCSGCACIGHGCIGCEGCSGCACVGHGCSGCGCCPID